MPTPIQDAAARAFNVTRLELITIVGAMLVLASFAVPAFDTYVERARTARAVSDIGTMGLALHRWQRNTHALPATLAEAGIDAVDPWGRPYAYLRIAGASATRLRRNKAFAPLNTDFDLYSYGPNGLSQPSLAAAVSLDDIVRANDGSFIGSAHNY